MIYLDNNATTRLDPAVAAAMHEVALMRLSNPASQHREGARARRVLEQFRLSIAERLGAKTDGMDTDRLLLTSGGTESNNLAVFGLARPGSRVLISSIEHPSVTTAGQRLVSVNHTTTSRSEHSRRQSTDIHKQHHNQVTNNLSTNSPIVGNFDVRAVPVDSDGVVRLDQLEELLQEAETSLVCLMAANNETGVIQPFKEACEMAHRHGALFHCDAVQWVGKKECQFRQWNVDSMSVACHKFHGPVGVGGLLLRSGLQMTPQLFGGFQQDGLRPGTESTVLAAGFSKALEISLESDCSTVEQLRVQLETALLDLGEEISINGSRVPRMPHTINVALGKVDRQAFLLAADIQGLCLSAGSACASGSSEPSPVLMAMGVSKQMLNSSIRISLGRDTTAEEIQLTIGKIRKIYASFQK